MKQLLIFLLAFSSCVQKHYQDLKKEDIVLWKVGCGSYEVKNNHSTIGYLIPLIYKEVDSTNYYIMEFENLIRNRLPNYYNKCYRVYVFTTDNNNELILKVTMLSPKHIKFIPNWQCELQDIDKYKPKHIKTPHYLFVDYNCTKHKLITQIN